MPDRSRVVLFTEVNSKLGSPFLRVLSAHPLINLVAVVTSPAHKVCSYFVNDATKVNIEAEARALGIEVHRPSTVSDAAHISQISESKPDYFFVANFQQKLTADLLAVPRIAAINFHPSPLPRYAGLAPFYWMVRNGERLSAISVIKMDEGLDTGPIIMQRQFSLSGNETSIELRTFQEKQNVLMLLELIPKLAGGAFSCVPQDLSKRTYCGRPAEQDYLLNFSDEMAGVLRQIRAGYRHPGAHFFLEDRTRIVVLSAKSVIPAGLKAPDTPGRMVIAHGSDAIFISALDGWIQLLTVEIDGKEVSVTPVNLPGVLMERFARAGKGVAVFSRKMTFPPQGFNQEGVQSA
ncbi:methionyl-tRNA formyltransferase [Verminephrobacter eiseniae]|uniref:methionyl-tRNA formyltransferase n=1 Tax=Verminephrobacter eiseniae TaxID=364317 RepID=UPI00223798B2|nr:formyltransferase family protein [Verminephrobacter eiseniae]MCW5235627.1 formyl transferase [Verminephrobacter eiseniae]